MAQPTAHRNLLQISDLFSISGLRYRPCAKVSDTIGAFVKSEKVPDQAVPLGHGLRA
jgi:hypothetical protein